MNKIFLGLERYNLTGLNFYGLANPLVAEQSVHELMNQMDPKILKTVTASKAKNYPCDSQDKNTVFFGSEYGNPFVKDLGTLKLNEGWTVTYWSLQVLYWIGCQQVVIVGMDHSFQQSGAPGKEEIFKEPDVNHFDDSYFAGKKWHLAGLGNNENFYRIARKTFEKAGREILDATPGGKCTVFKKV